MTSLTSGFEQTRASYVEVDKSRHSFHSSEHSRNDHCNLCKTVYFVVVVVVENLCNQQQNNLAGHTIFAIHHARRPMMFVAQPRVFIATTVSVILVVRLRCVVVRGAKDLLTLRATEFRIEHVSLYDHPGQDHNNGGVSQIVVQLTKLPKARRTIHCSHQSKT